MAGRGEQRQKSHATDSVISVHVRSGLLIPLPLLQRSLPGQPRFLLLRLSPRRRPRRAPRSQTPFQSRTAARRAVGSQRALQACRKLKEQKPTSLCFSHRPALWGCLSRGEGTHSPNSGAASARRSAAGAAPSVQNQFHVPLPGAAGEAAHLQRPPRTSRHAGLGSSRERETEPGVWRRNPVSRC